VDVTHPQPSSKPATDAVPPEKAPLETLLLRSGVLTLRQISEAHRIVDESGKQLTEVLLENGWVPEETLAKLTADQEPPALPETAAVYVVFANLEDGARLEISAHDDAASARVSAAGAVELVESNAETLLELGDRRFPASAVDSIEIVEIA
jgi:hypothetical protein